MRVRDPIRIAVGCIVRPPMAEKRVGFGVIAKSKRDAYGRQAESVANAHYWIQKKKTF